MGRLPGKIDATRALLEGSSELQALVRVAVKRLGIWIDPAIYVRRPHLVPFAVRDASCRSKANKDAAETWGAPDERGYFRDDNSLIKNWVKSLTVRSPLAEYSGKRIGSGFVACHVWRGTHDGRHLHADPLLNSFVPNLVWLPSDLARMSDRVGSYTQRLLQGMASRLYASIDVVPPLCGVTAESWRRLDLPAEPPPCSIDNLSFFSFSSEAMARQQDSLSSVVSGIRDIRSGRHVERVYSRRYGPGLKALSPEVLDDLLAFLEPYAALSAR